MFLCHIIIYPRQLDVQCICFASASKDLTATITLPKAEDFSFLDGGLCSDYKDEDEIQFAITKGHNPVLPPQYRQHKIQE